MGLHFMKQNAACESSEYITAVLEIVLLKLFIGFTTYLTFFVEILLYCIVRQDISNFNPKLYKNAQNVRKAKLKRFVDKCLQL